MQPRVRSALFGVAIALPIVAAVTLVQRRPSAALPVYWALPNFSLVDQDSAVFSSTDLAGQVWLVSFAYTHCPDICPLVTQRMAELRAELESKRTLGEVRLLTITVDPQRDSPSVLRNYSQQWQARKPNWYFLTGQPDSVFSLVERGFRLTLMHPAREHNAHQHADYTVSHTDRIVLVDQKLQVRGTYPLSDPGSRAQLSRDLEQLR